MCSGVLMVEKPMCCGVLMEIKGLRGTSSEAPFQTLAPILFVTLPDYSHDTNLHFAILCSCQAAILFEY